MNQVKKNKWTFKALGLSVLFFALGLGFHHLKAEEVESTGIAEGDEIAVSKDSDAKYQESKKAMEKAGGEAKRVVGAWYIAGGAGTGFVGANDGFVNPGGPITVNTNFSTVLGVLGGYHWLDTETHLAWTVEAEAAYIGTGHYLSLPSMNTALNIGAFMVNGTVGYHIGNFEPYVGFGVGAVVVNAEVASANIGTNWAFAFQPIAGVRYFITAHWLAAAQFEWIWTDTLSGYNIGATQVTIGHAMIPLGLLAIGYAF
ncbi:outer membrane beta-barrel protein [Methylacidiphilum caldifontis]|uniref:Uncharacterized protein n=1 Tax=Methylacidiphilum caldifontis TaxID=2795386 RepID=A0A4Y8PCE5_9BACT|nr:outer membrane beta-barrel protein [Methylacidiphilum caldifontis]TFE68910.1 hypothetical protein A7Q10_07385 [Methylacidiphilum caldifontis]